jgi:HD-GYP domain-containing protein (c-di-GMP phosphodiesterase class II)
MFSDIVRAADNAIAIEGFAVELMDAYAQIRLLYRIGRSMTGGKRPEVFVRELCRELEENTRFAWVAAKFPAEFDPAPGLSDKLIRSGSPSCALGLFEGLVNDTARLITEDGHRVLKPESDLLARRVNSEVLAHAVIRDSGPIGCLLAGEKSGEDPEISSVDTQLLDAAADFLGVFLDNTRLYQRQREIFLGTLQALTASIDAKDPYTRGHSERVAVLAAKLAEKMGMSPEHVERIRITGIVHDVGKIGVPEAVLRKTDRLTDAEFALMKQHPEIGHKILQDVPQFSDVLPGVLHHHERWDGNGYPHRLAGDDIPLDARILSIADAFDAMSSDRSYRPAMSRENVMAEIRRCTGTQFDPDIAPLFLELDLSVYDRMVREHTVRYRHAA